MYSRFLEKLSPIPDQGDRHRRVAKHREDARRPGPDARHRPRLLDRTARAAAGGATKDPEKMEFLEIVELEFSKKENAGKPDFAIIRELTMKYPAKHRAALEKKDPATGNFIGLAKLPRRAVPFKRGLIPFIPKPNSLEKREP